MCSLPETARQTIFPIPSHHLSLLPSHFLSVTSALPSKSYSTVPGHERWEEPHNRFIRDDPTRPAPVRQAHASALSDPPPFGTKKMG